MKKSDIFSYVSAFNKPRLIAWNDFMNIFF